MARSESSFFEVLDRLLDIDRHGFIYLRFKSNNRNASIACP